AKLLRAFLAAADASLPELEGVFWGEVRSAPGDDAAWNAYSDWLIDQGRPAAGLTVLERGLRRAGRHPVLWVTGHGLDRQLLGKPETAERALDEAVRKLRGNLPNNQPSRSLVRVDEHIAQLCLHVQGWEWNDYQLYHQWIYFDDLWASAHADLAN